MKKRKSAALAYHVEGSGFSSVYEIGTGVAALLGMGAGALKWSRALSEGRRAAALGLCVAVAPACGVPAWIQFGSGETRLGWAFVLAGSFVAVPLLAGCVRNWKALEGSGEVYREGG